MKGIKLQQVLVSHEQRPNHTERMAHKDPTYSNQVMCHGIWRTHFQTRDSNKIMGNVEQIEK
jgi:hypothetical protein